MQRPSKWTCREEGWKKPNTFFAYIVFVNRFLHLCHYKTTFCQNNLSKSEDYFWNTYSRLQKHYALWVMAKIVALLKNFQMLFEKNVTSNVTRNQKLKHIYISTPEHTGSCTHKHPLTFVYNVYTHLQTTGKLRETMLNYVNKNKLRQTVPNYAKSCKIM